MAKTSKWNGRTAVVTGAASGIGAALATELSARGASVVLTDVDEARAKEKAAELGAEAMALDVTDGEAFADVVQAVVREHGRVDYLFNNAGIGIGGDCDALAPEHWDRIVDINIRGTVNGVRAAYPVMLDQGDGHLVNTASMAGLLPLPLLTPYAMTKHAIVGLSTSLRIEAAARGVRVTALCPGPVETALLDVRGADLDPPIDGGFDPRRYLTSILGKPYPADRMASDALDGVARNRAVVVIPGKGRVFTKLGALAPNLLASLTGRAVADERSHWT